MPRTVYNSLGEHSALLGQPLLLDDTEDRNYMHEIFFLVPTGEDRCTDVGLVWKLDLQNLRFLLGHDNVYHWHIWDRRPLR